jgi:hypothetical protein
MEYLQMVFFRIGALALLCWPGKKGLSSPNPDEKCPLWSCCLTPGFDTLAA